MAQTSLPDAKIRVVLDIEHAKKQLADAKTGKGGDASGGPPVDTPATFKAPTRSGPRAAATTPKTGAEEILSSAVRDYTRLAWRVRGGFETVQSAAGAAEGGLDYLVGAGESAIAGRVTGALGTYGTGLAVGAAGVAAGAAAVYGTYKAAQAGSAALSGIGAAYSGYASAFGAGAMGSGIESRFQAVEDWINDKGMQMQRFWEQKLQPAGFMNSDLVNQAVRHGAALSDQERSDLNRISRTQKDNDARLERTIERNMDHRLGKKIGNDLGNWFRSFMGF